MRELYSSDEDDDGAATRTTRGKRRDHARRRILRECSVSCEASSLPAFKIEDDAALIKVSFYTFARAQFLKKSLFVVSI